MIVEPFASDQVEDDLNPAGRVFYCASTMVCTPNSLDQGVTLSSVHRLARRDSVKL